MSDMPSAIKISVVDVSSPLIPVKILNEIAESIEQGRKNKDPGLVDLGKRLLQISSAWKDTMLYDCSIKTQNAWFEDHFNQWKEGDGVIFAMTDKIKTALNLGRALKGVTNLNLRRIIERGYIPNFDLNWVKFLVNLQIFGGIGTWEDICTFSGIDPKQLSKYGWLRFFLYYDLLRVVKRKKGGRIFELGEAGEATIDYVATH